MSTIREKLATEFPDLYTLVPLPLRARVLRIAQRAHFTPAETQTLLKEMAQLDTEDLDAFLTHLETLEEVEEE